MSRVKTVSLSRPICPPLKGWTGVPRLKTVPPVPMSVSKGVDISICPSLKELRHFQPKLTGQNGQIQRGNPSPILKNP